MICDVVSTSNSGMTCPLSRNEVIGQKGSYQERRDSRMHTIIAILLRAEHRVKHSVHLSNIPVAMPLLIVTDRSRRPPFVTFGPPSPDHYNERIGWYH